MADINSTLQHQQLTMTTMNNNTRSHDNDNENDNGTIFHNGHLHIIKQQSLYTTAIEPMFLAMVG